MHIASVPLTSSMSLFFSLDSFLAWIVVDPSRFTSTSSFFHQRRWFSTRETGLEWCISRIGGRRRIPLTFKSFLLLKRCTVPGKAERFGDRRGWRVLRPESLVSLGSDSGTHVLYLISRVQPIIFAPALPVFWRFKMRAARKGIYSFLAQNTYERASEKAVDWGESRTPTCPTVLVPRTYPRELSRDFGRSIPPHAHATVPYSTRDTSRLGRSQR